MGASFLVARGAASAAALPRLLGGGRTGEKQGQPPARRPPWRSLSPWVAEFHSQPKSENKHGEGGGFTVCVSASPNGEAWWIGTLFVANAAYCVWFCTVTVTVTLDVQLTPFL